MHTFGFLLLLLLGQNLAEKEPEPVFRPVGSELEIGFCFGVDYIAVYKLTEKGRQLLGNSSDSSVLPPEEYRDRITLTNQNLEGLLGLQVANLKASDSGVYLRECWHNNKIVNQHKHYLYVCDKEVDPHEIYLLPDGSADLFCNITHFGQDATIKWFRQGNVGTQKPLILDTKISQEPLEEEMKDLIQVHNQGFSLRISLVGLKDEFYCLVMKGEQCRMFRNLYMSDSSDEADVLSVFYGVGEKAVLACSSSENIIEGLKYWKTPFGQVDTISNMGSKTSQMYMSNNEETGKYSLVIPSITLNHSGDYTCVSSDAEAEYFITVCSEIMTKEINSHPGNKVNLGCPMTDIEQVNIQWYRKGALKTELIYDSGDHTLKIPNDVSDRMHILEEQHSLVITEVTESDSGTYWCIILLDDMDYPENIDVDQENEDEEEEDDDDESQWIGEDENIDKCIFKQVTQLKVKWPEPGPKARPKTKSEPEPQPEPEPEPEPEPSSPLYPIIGAVAGFIMLVLIVTVVVLVKRKAKRKEMEPTELNTRHKENTSEPLMNA